MVPSRAACDVLGGMLHILQQFGAVPRRGVGSRLLCGPMAPRRPSGAISKPFGARWAWARTCAHRASRARVVELARDVRSRSRRFVKDCGSPRASSELVYQPDIDSAQPERLTRAERAELVKFRREKTVSQVV
jgi:hypothetical protein